MAVAAFVLIAAGTVLATPPDRIRLSYSDSSSTLTIAVHHPTFFVAAHHVAKIAVMLNDSLVALQQFSGQTNKQEQDTHCVVLGAKPGDRLTVTAVCSLFGKRTETLVLPSSSP
jgi:desulfoferrodoxin (superoxide reductase-like protein)